MSDDTRWLAAALALGERGVGRTSPNPSVGCILVHDGRVVARGWTQPGGRPHAEAMALDQAGALARGATAYVSLEPCAHVSPRGPACADRLAEAGIARVVAAADDPDPRTDGAGMARLAAAGIATASNLLPAEAEAANPGFFSRQRRGRPFVTLKLALSLDGCLALADGRSRWITGPAARAHAHLERARADLVVVGRGTWEADAPSLDVRLPGLEDRSPSVAVLTSSPRPARERPQVAPPPRILHDIAELDTDPAILAVLVEGGARVAASLLAEDRVDRLLVHRAPLLLGGRPGIAPLALPELAASHGRWALVSRRAAGPDQLEEYARTR